MVLFMFVKWFIFLSLLGTLLSSVDTTSLSTTSTALKPFSVYKLELSGQVVERVSEDDQASFAVAEALGNSSQKLYGLKQILENIKFAKENDNICGIYLYGGELSANTATLREIRQALLDFKRSGKFIVAYANDYSQGSYYLASVADKICLNPAGSLDWRGLFSSVQYLKRLMDKVGVEMQVFKVGTYKSAVEPYILTEMSDANREQTEALLDVVWNDITTAVGESRDISVMQLNDLADRNLMFEDVQTVLDEGMVDTLVYATDMKNILTALCDTADYTLLSYSKMQDAITDTNKAKDVVAMIYAEGDIVEEGTGGIVAGKLIKDIDKVAEDDDVKAVVLRVNSPGGSAAASEHIWYALAKLKDTGKPLVVSMGDYAASGGYYISCNADYIFAQPTTLTGSIGIFGLVPNVAKVIDKVGIDFDGVATNEHSGVLQTMTIAGLDKDEARQVQLYVNRGYELFTKRCADGRNTTQEEIKKIAEGRVWTGTQALQLGLVDSLGNINDAIEKAAQLAFLDEYKVVDYPKAKSMYEKLLAAFNGEEIADRYAQARLGEAYRLAKQIQQLPKKPTIEARMEYLIKIE